MKKSKFLVALACFGLLVTGCNKPAASSEAKPTSTSGAASQPASTPASTPASNPQSSAPTSSSQAPAHEHSYQAVGSAVKNADGKDVFLKECTAKDSKYIGIAFDDYSEKSADFGSTSGYNNVPEELRNESRLLAKNSTVTWKINIDKAISNAKIAFGVVYTGNDHGSQGAADGGTVKYSVQINANDFVDWDIGEKTYDDLGLSQTARGYVEYVTANLVAGENKITLRQNNAGYRLLYGGEVRIMYTGDAVPVAGTPAFEGYKVTFSGEHCKVYVYDTKDYTKTPKETNSCVAKDEEGNIVAYDPEDEQLQPQVNFKVVCDEGYSLNASNFKITGKYNKLKQGPAEADGLPDAEHFRITKVQEDLAVVITPVQGEQAKGYKMTFAATNCSVKVYIGPKNAEGTNLDTAEEGVYYARSKDSPYDFTFSAPQLNFEVVCNDGYEFKPEIDAEGKVNFITFAAAEGKIGYNKFKANEDGTYNMTKIDSDLTITIAATQKTQPVEDKVITLNYSGLTATGSEIKAEEALAKIGQGDAHVKAVTATKIYDGNGTGGAYANTAGLLKTGTGSAAGQIVLTLDVDASKVEISCHDWYKKTADHPTNSNNVAVNGSADQLAPYNEEGTFGALTFELASASKTVTIDAKNRIFIKEIKITYADGGETPAAPLKVWDAAATKAGLSNASAKEVKDTTGDVQFTVYKLGTKNDYVEFKFTPTEAKKVVFNYTFTTKAGNATKTFFWHQDAAVTTAVKHNVYVNGTKIDAPADSNPSFQDFAGGADKVIESEADDGGKLANPITVALFEFDLVANQENVIKIEYVGSGYSTYVAGASLIAK